MIIIFNYMALDSMQLLEAPLYYYLLNRYQPELAPMVFLPLMEEIPGNRDPQSGWGTAAMNRAWTGWALLFSASTYARSKAMRPTNFVLRPRVERNGRWSRWGWTRKVAQQNDPTPCSPRARISSALILIVTLNRRGWPWGS